MPLSLFIIILDDLMPQCIQCMLKIGGLVPAKVYLITGGY